jgi:hypothetical protein
MHPSRQAHHAVIEDRVLGRVEARGGHLAGHRHAHRVGDPLAERTGGGLDPGGLAELRVPGRGAVQRAEFPHLLHRQGVAAQVQPRVQEHAPVAGREDEAVPVGPAGTVRVVDQGVPVEHGTDIGAAQRKAEVAGTARVDRVNRQATGLVRRLGQDLGVEAHAPNSGRVWGSTATLRGSPTTPWCRRRRGPPRRERRQPPRCAPPSRGS